MSLIYNYGGKQYDVETAEGKAAFANALSEVSPETLQDIKNQEYIRERGGGMTNAELRDFETLISRLEGSKLRQAAQSNRARQRDTFAAGLANMMGNF